MFIERRKLIFLLAQANTTMKQVDERFRKIDKIMKGIKAGELVYEYDPFDGYYPKVVTRIIDRESGLIETFEESIKKKEIKCILDYCMEVE